MSEPIPFPRKSESESDSDTGDDATEVTLEGLPLAGRETQRLPAEPDLIAGLSEVLLAPFDLLPAETRAHLRTAGREATLTVASLTGTLLKGAAIALNIAAESLKDYSARHSVVNDLDAARHRRQRVEIEVE
ncbi:MAG TPA: hypothetical protein VKY74_09910 [Chloroflexia bacterium]|nr:hypothetical protein [Chloroflexia bacterium]